MTARSEVRYEASPTAARFHNDSESFVRGLMGPVGSGKSVACTAEVFRRMNEQGKSRWAVIRNTYRELEDTTLRTWMDWLRHYGTFKHSTMTHYIQLPDGQQGEVLFRALDKPSDIGKLLSLELTGAWINEAREIPYAILQNLMPRVLRYPSAAEDPDAYHGIIMDTNPPDDLHWWYQKFEEQRPDGFRLYRQPGGRSEHAENTQNLVSGYYDTISQGQDQAWIDVYVNGNYGFLMDGKPVYPEYNDSVHCASGPLELDSAARHVVGVDFGLTPAALFWQQTTDGQWQARRELVTQDMAAFEFADLLGQVLRSEYRGLNVEIYGDPAGEQRAQTDANTPFKILRAKGIQIQKAPDNDERMRHDSLARHMRRMTMTGQPGVLISPDCKYFRRGLAGGYKYRLIQVAGDERFHEKPEKNIYSHICEAGEYGLYGSGEGAELVGHAGMWDPIDYSELNKAAI